MALTLSGCIYRERDIKLCTGRKFSIRFGAKFHDLRTIKRPSGILFSKELNQRIERSKSVITHCSVNVLIFKINQLFDIWDGNLFIKLFRSRYHVYLTISGFFGPTGVRVWWECDLLAWEKYLSVPIKKNREAMLIEGFKLCFYQIRKSSLRHGNWLVAIFTTLRS